MSGMLLRERGWNMGKIDLSRFYHDDRAHLKLCRASAAAVLMLLAWK